MIADDKDIEKSYLLTNVTYVNGNGSLMEIIVECYYRRVKQHFIYFISRIPFNGILTYFINITDLSIHKRCKEINR